MRPSVLRLAVALLLMAPHGAGSAPAAAESAAADQPAPARKVLVVAKIKEETQRRALEERASAELKKRGVETTLGSDVLTEADFASEDAIRTKVRSLDVDGVVGYVPLAVDETVKTSSAHVSIGVGGYGGGGMGMFVGASAPIGGSTTVVRTLRLRARYFARPFEAPAWEKVYTEKLKENTSALIDYLARDTAATLKKKKLIPAK